MDFFERQDQARRSTSLLIFYFVVAVVLLVIAVNLACILALGMASRGDIILPPITYLLISAFTLAVIFFGSVYKTMSLQGGGSAVSLSLGARPVSTQTNDPHERQLLNVVEEMAIASGTPIPPVFVLDDEPGINAFAAGFSSRDATVTVSRGCMQLLSRDELQGVVAHEFSHILNGDMRLNIRLIGVLYGILCIFLLGKILLYTAPRRSSSRKSGGAGGILVFGLLLLLIGSVGVLAAKLIKSAISRQREFLADASAVQFTRNPGGIAGALKKIGGLSCGSRLTAPNAEEASHLFFANGVEPSWHDWFATHPPLSERIKAIDPNFDGTFPDIHPNENSVPPTTSSQQQNLTGLDEANPLSPLQAFTPATLARTVGTVTPAHLDHAQNLVSQIPPPLLQAAREPHGARAIIFGLLLAGTASGRQEVFQQLQQKSDPGICLELRQVVPQILSLPETLKLPLLDISIPALRELSLSQYQQFLENIQTLVAVDNSIDLFEYTLYKAIERRLDPHFHPKPPVKVRFNNLTILAEDCSILLSCLANLHAEPDTRQKAYDLGVQALAIDPQLLKLLPAETATLTALDNSLNQLTALAPGLKKSIINACAAIISADATVTVQEMEVIRAIADALDCPIPPFIDQLPLTT